LGFEHGGMITWPIARFSMNLLDGAVVAAVECFVWSKWLSGAFGRWPRDGIVYRFRM
jgi:hypothetical protein